MSLPLLDAHPWEDVAERLGALLARAGADGPKLEPLTPGPAPPRVAAIDGSSLVLAQSGAFLLGAYRAASATLASSGAAPVVREQPTRVVLFEAGREDAELRERLRAAGHDGGAPRPEERLHLVRELSELEHALETLAGLERGDVLLLDGPLQTRPFSTLARRLVDEAGARGVDVVGVCKSTSLTVGGVPALAACHLAARDSRLTRWLAPLAAPPFVLGETFVAALSPAEARAFRFDVCAHDGDARRVLAGLAPLARHPAYPGYPAPLALVHNAATLTEEARGRLRASLAAAAARHGVTEDAWRAAFEDYHDILDLGV